MVNKVLKSVMKGSTRQRVEIDQKQDLFMYSMLMQYFIVIELHEKLVAADKPL